MSTPVWKRKELWGIVIFIILAMWGLYGSRAEASELRIGLSGPVTSRLKDVVGLELLLSHRNWYLGAAKFDDGEDKDPRIPELYRFALGWTVQWREGKAIEPFLRFGVAYWDTRAVDIISDHLTYDMRLGLRFHDIIELEYSHNSTGGRSEQNEGYDFIHLGLVKAF